MTTLNRVRVQGYGYPGGPGVSTFYFLDTTTACDSLYTLFNGFQGATPNSVNYLVESAGDQIEDTTGELVGAWSATPESIVDCSNTSSYQGPTGVLLKWHTDTILDGHRVSGQTFMVPIAAGVFDNTGHVGSSDLAGFAGYASAFVIAQDASFVIWHRPRAAKAADGSRPAVTARVGGHGLVTRSSVSTKAAVLRSRRD